MVLKLMEFGLSIPGRIYCKLGIHSWYYYTKFREAPGVKKYRYCIRDHCQLRQFYHKEARIWMDQ